MPSERFYYRPIDPGYAQMGAGLAQGILGGVDRYYDEKDRIAERQRMEEEDQRRKEREDLYLDIELASMGGGRGAPPRPPSVPDLEYGRPGMARRTGPGNILTRPVEEQLREGLPPTSTLREPSLMEQMAADPEFDRYLPVGPEDFAYIEDPEFARERAQREEMESGARMAQARRGQIGAYLTGRHPKQSPEQISAAAGLIAEGVADYPDLFPTQNRRWYPTTRQEAESWAQFESKLGRTPGGAGTTGAGVGTVGEAMTLNQALDAVETMYEYTPEEEQPSNAQKIAMAMALTRGEVPDFPPTISGEEIPEVELPPIRVPPPASRRQALTAADITAIKAELQRFDKEDWPDVLKANGFDDNEIKAILGR